MPNIQQDIEDKKTIDSYLEVFDRENQIPHTKAFTEKMINHIGVSDFVGYAMRKRQHLPALKTFKQKVEFYEKNEALFTALINEMPADDLDHRQTYLSKLELMSHRDYLYKELMAGLVETVFIKKDKTSIYYVILIENLVDGFIDAVVQTFKEYQKRLAITKILISK